MSTRVDMAVRGETDRTNTQTKRSRASPSDVTATQYDKIHNPERYHTCSSPRGAAMRIASFSVSRNGPFSA